MRCWKVVLSLDERTLMAKLGDAERGLASAEGKSKDYQSIRVR